MFPIWNFLLERKAFTILVMFALILSGIVAINTIPKEAMPEVVLPMGVVSASLPGATASDMERLVTDKLEPAITNLPNIDKVTSSSRQGVTMITAQFIASADIETSIQDLRNAVEQAKGNLPSDVNGPVVSKVDFQNQPVMMIGVSSELTPEALYDLGNKLEENLLTISGVSKVDISGIRAREVSIIVNSNSLTTYGIAPGQVIGALQSANASIPAGSITIDNIDYPVQFNGNIEQVSDLANIPIATQTGEIRLSDVANIVDGFQKASSISRLSESGSEISYAMTLNVYKSSGGNILTVTDKVEEKLKDLESSVLLGSNYVVIYDAGDEIKKSIGELTGAGRDTIILVVLVLLIAVGFREAIVSALSIPFSFMIAFLGMWMSGNTINFISLFSLVIAIGILVDSGIVIVEGIYSNRKKGMDKISAARETIRQYSWPLIAGTVTTVAIFVPLLFLSGIMGKFLFSIPFTIIIVLLSSIVVALGIVPLLATKILSDKESKYNKYRDAFWNSLNDWYQEKLTILLNNRKAQKIFYGILTVLFIVSIALPVSGLLKATMFPPEDMDLFYVEVELPQASTLASTDTVTREVEKKVAEMNEVSSFMTTIGSGSAFNYEAGSGSKIANITVNLEKDRDHTSIEITSKLRSELSSLQGMNGAKITVTEVSSGPPAGAPVVIKIWSDSTENLAKATAQVESIIMETEGTRDTSSSLSNDGTELLININRERAAEYGLSASDVAMALRTAISGVEATKLRVDGEDLPVVFKIALNQNYEVPEEITIVNADAIASTPILTQRGNIPLGSLISISANRTSTSINHENGKRIGTVGAFLEVGANPIEVTNNIRTAIDSAETPAGVTFTYGGDDEEITRTFTEMMFAMIAGLVLMFAVLVIEFNAFRTTLRLLIAIPLSLTGVLIGLFVMGQALSLTAFLGIIALSGVIINHGILLLDILNKIKEDGEITDPKEQILKATTSRMRPILLTTITTVVGMIPLMFVSEMWAPLAYTMAFGLLYGTVLTLILIPLLSYNYLLKQSKK